MNFKNYSKINKRIKIKKIIIKYFTILFLFLVLFNSPIRKIIVVEKTKNKTPLINGVLLLNIVVIIPNIVEKISEIKIFSSKDLKIFIK